MSFASIVTPRAVRTARRLHLIPRTRGSPTSVYCDLTHRRSLFNFLRKSPKHDPQTVKESGPLLSDDDLLHPFSKSPFPAVRARGEAVCSLAKCPVCTTAHANARSNLAPSPLPVKFECPDCGWPTHCSEEHWKEDEEHKKYCSRLKEVNEDEHDLRRGRRMVEFELPGEHEQDEALSFANWDIFWYTRGFPSMDTERARRHASKLLTYPITIGSLLHQYSSLTLNNQRLTPQGSRSLAALRSNLHPPTGSPESQETGIGKPQMRIFVLGARAESSLPPHVWEQLCMLFPAATFHIYFIGPQVSLPKPRNADSSSDFRGSSPSQSSSESPTSSPSSAQTTSQPDAAASEKSRPTTNEGSIANVEEEKPIYVPNVYEPPTPAPIARLKRTRESIALYGVPSYTVPYTYQLTITGMQANYADVHAQFAETLDPYTDCFFFCSPGFGWPSPISCVEGSTTERLLQAASPTEWGPVLPALLASKCAMFVTGFSPTDVERDVRALSVAPGVAGEFDWVITPGPNPFGSEKWEVADFDPRVMVKTNWGVWGIRGKTREIRERWM